MKRKKYYKLWISMSCSIYYHVNECSWCFKILVFLTMALGRLHLSENCFCYYEDSDFRFKWNSNVEITLQIYVSRRNLPLSKHVSHTLDFTNPTIIMNMSNLRCWMKTVWLTLMCWLYILFFHHENVALIIYVS